MERATLGDRNPFAKKTFLNSGTGSRKYGVGSPQHHLSDGLSNTYESIDERHKRGSTSSGSSTYNQHHTKHRATTLHKQKGKTLTIFTLFELQQVFATTFQVSAHLIIATLHIQDQINSLLTGFFNWKKVMTIKILFRESNKSYLDDIF